MLAGPGKNPTLDPDAMPSISKWLSTEGARMMFIYGENDPYTAAAFELGGAQDSFRFVVPKGNHGAAIHALTQTDLDTVLSALKRWTGVPPIPPSKAAFAQGPRRMFFQRRRWLP